MLTLISDYIKLLATIAENDNITRHKQYNFIETPNFCRSIDSKQCNDLVYQKIQKYIQLYIYVDRQCH